MATTTSQFTAMTVKHRHQFNKGTHNAKELTKRPSSYIYIYDRKLLR